MLIDFCLPVRNEAKILQANALKLKSFLETRALAADWQIVIIVNGSDDTSSLIAAELVKTGGGRFKMENIEPGGKGLALRYYFFQSSADVLVFMDVDLAVALDNISALITPLLDGSADLVMGSRLLPESKTSRSWSRSIVSRVYNHFSRLILGHRYSDLQCGFKAISRELFRQIAPFWQDNNWFFDTELVISAWCRGFRIKEIPVDWRENRYDKKASKIRVWIDSWVFAKNLIGLRTRLKKIRKYRDNV